MADRDDIYIDETKRGYSWFCAWIDHAGRVVRRSLGTVEALGPHQTPEHVRRAERVVGEYMANQAVQYSLKLQATPDELEQLCFRAFLPREVVAEAIKEICHKLSRHYTDDQGSEVIPGLKIFSDRLADIRGKNMKVKGITKQQMGLCTREAHRIVEDKERISVGTSIVDMLCVEFDVIYDDFIQDSLAWADKTGRWQNRFGTKDSWPFGYPVDKLIDEDII